MAEVGADGINGDTQDGVPLAFSLAADKSGIRWLSSRRAVPRMKRWPGT